MNNDHVLQSLADVEVHLKLLAAATRTDELIKAAWGYLACWDEIRIKNLQKIDGGWGPFDQHQRPEPIRGVAHLMQKSDCLRTHCLALKDAGFDPTPELLELDLYFAIAKQVAESLVSARQHPYTVNSGSTRQWAATDALAA